jgi:hypothetical protein
MVAMVIIEDQLHADVGGEFSSFDDALREVRRLARIPWDQEPDRAPCGSWRTCGRAYEIIEYDDTVSGRTVLDRAAIVEIDSEGVRWEDAYRPVAPGEGGGQAAR